MPRSSTAALVLAAALAGFGCEAEKPQPRRQPAKLGQPVPVPHLPKPPPLARDGTWPASREGCVFAFDTAEKPVTAFAPDGSLIRGYGVFLAQLQARDLAVPDRWGRLRVTGGSYQATGAGPYVAEAARRAGAFSVESVLAPDGLAAAGPAEIVSFGPPQGPRNFALAQDGRRLVLLLRTSAPKAARVPILEFSSTRPVHVAVTYRPGTLAAYLNGRPVHETAAVTGDLANWAAGDLVLGSAPDRRGDWAGTLEGVAVYARALAPEEVELGAEARLKALAERPVPAVLKVRARLLARSPTPSYERIKPHWQAVAGYLYEVEEVLQGRCEAKRIVVFHWTMLDKKMLPFAHAPVGQTYDLVLDPYDDQRLLRDVPRFDDLYDDKDLGAAYLDWPAYYDAGGLSLQWRP
jgi:hypothetical protein